MSPDEVADRYFQVVRDRDVEALVALYADDAILVLPNGSQVVGTDATRAFQTDVFARGAPYPTPGPRVSGVREVAVEIEATLPDGSVRRTANFFYVDDGGRIRRLNVYARSG